MMAMLQGEKSTNDKGRGGRKSAEEKEESLSLAVAAATFCPVKMRVEHE